MKSLTIVIIFITISSVSLLSQTEAGLGLKLNKSLTVAAGNVDYYDSEDSEEIRSVEILNGTIGIGADLLYKISKSTYFNMAVTYNSYSIDNSIKFEGNKKLEASSIDLIIDGVYYFSALNEFTPYAGAGGGFIFINSNEDNLKKSNAVSNFFQDKDSHYFSELNLFFNIKVGLHFPVNEKIFCYTDFDFVMVTATNLGIIPKINIGCSYWLK